MKISVVVPLYKTPKYLIDITRKILADRHEDKEIIVVVDGTMTPEIEAVLSSLGSAVTVHYPNEHLGKAEALNRAVGQLTTDAILFLDNDVLLPEDPGFLTIVERKMESFDIVEMPKEVISESFFSEMIGFEYQSLAIANLSFSLLAGRSPGLIGSAFAVRKKLFDRLGGFRRVVHEDGDFGARSFRLHARFAYDLRLKVRTSMPNTLRDWITQRKRWTLINVLWFKENFLYLLLSVFKQPSLIPVLGLMALPSILSLIVFVVFNHFNLSFMNPVFMMVTQPIHLVAGILLWFSHHALYSDGLLSTAMGFLSTTVIYFIFSRIARFPFNIFTFIVFYFLYMPLLVVINVLMFVVLLVDSKIELDWKV